MRREDEENGIMESAFRITSLVAATGTAKVGSLKKQLRQTEAECAELATQLAVCTHGYNLLSILNDRTLQLSALPSLEREREKDYNKSKNKNER